MNIYQSPQWGAIVAKINKMFNLNISIPAMGGNRLQILRMPTSAVYQSPQWGAIVLRYGAASAD